MEFFIEGKISEGQAHDKVRKCTLCDTFLTQWDGRKLPVAQQLHTPLVDAPSQEDQLYRYNASSTTKEINQSILIK